MMARLKVPYVVKRPGVSNILEIHLPSETLAAFLSEAAKF